jgi:hypothetical protein
LRSSSSSSSPSSPSSPSPSPAEWMPKAASRYIPCAVRRQVARRDENRCAFRDASGNRCTATRGLEYHHIVPHALQGPPTVSNVSLRCQSHNLHQARIDFGEEVVQRAICRARPLA